MMVAIMGDTYSEIMENKQVSGIKTKIELISEVLTTKGKQAESGFQKEHLYLFVVEPLDEEGNAETDWEGVVGQVQKAISRSTASLMKEVGKAVADLQE